MDRVGGGHAVQRRQHMQRRGRMKQHFNVGTTAVIKYEKQPRWKKNTKRGFSYEVTLQFCEGDWILLYRKYQATDHFSLGIEMSRRVIEKDYFDSSTEERFWNNNTHSIYPGILLKCTLWFPRSRVRPQDATFLVCFQMKLKLLVLGPHWVARVEDRLMGDKAKVREGRPHTGLV